MAQAPLKINTYLTSEEIEIRYKTCKEAREKTHWQLIWLINNQLKSVKEASKITGICERWSRQLIHRYNERGAAGLEDKRKYNKGKEPELNEQQKEKLRLAISSGPPPDKGLWTSAKVGDWIKEQTGKTISGVASWKYLKKLGFTIQQPRPYHN